MAHKTGDTIHFWTSVSGPPDSVDEYARGANVRAVANGFLVKPVGSDADGSTYVFRDATEMTAWLRKRYTAKAK